MKRQLSHLSLTLILIVSFSSTAAAAGSAIVKAMNDLRWGMTEYELTMYLQTRMKGIYAEKIKKASESEKGRLAQEAQSRLRDITRSRVEFAGQNSTWDSGLVAYEFTHNNGESMIVSQDEKSTNYYFFINNALWKWYKAYNADAFRGKSFKQALSVFEGNLGKGIQKDVERVPGAGRRPVVEWRDRDTRVRALDESQVYGRYCLVFEELSMVAQLPSLRANADRRFAALRASQSKKTTVEAVSEPPSESASTDKKDKKGKSQGDDARAKRSVFAEEERAETASEYEARKQRIMDQHAAAERRKNEQKVAEKRAKALESLKGLDNNDPLGGL